MKFLFQDTALVDEASFRSAGERLAPYVRHLAEVAESGGYEADEASINLPSDSELLERVRGVAERLRKHELKYIVVIGIGGSNLGTQAVYDALFGELDAFSDRKPKILFADTVDAKRLRAIADILDGAESGDEIVLNVISKSGGTTETIANFSWMLQTLTERFGDMRSRVVVTTDEGSKLLRHAESEGYEHLAIPAKVGGRYSVLSSVGLFPLALAGVDIEALLRGAADIRAECLKPDPSENPALASAIIEHAHAKNGANISNLFLFRTDLESLGKWYRQLMGESVGKEKNIRGETVHAGITPIVSIGSTDLHSMAQLYLGGPRDKFTTFVSVQSSGQPLEVPETTTSALVDGVSGRSYDEILSAILAGTKEAYKKNDLPFAEVVLEKLSPSSIGAFLQFKMIEMMYLAALLEVNAFDQPNVEAYKEETRRILG